jgi:hypothetical protein
MEMQSTNLWVTGTVYLIYGSICIVALIFTFSLETYYKIDEIFNLELYLNRFMNPLLDRNVGYLEAWLAKYHKIVGPILTVLSLLDLKLSFGIINTFYMVIS